MNIRRFRIFQTLISIFLFIGVFLLCWDVTKFDLQNIQLSYFGVDPKLSLIWNGCITLLALSTFYNVYQFIKDHKRLTFKRFLSLVFCFTSLCLFFTGAVDMTHSIHNVTAYLYFFAYPLAIFLLAHLNRKHLQYKEWKTHVIFSICMVVLPLITIKLFFGMAITEIIHSAIVIGWNLWILLED